MVIEPRRPDEIGIFKMATAERREARRRKLLQNPEDRLKKIMGSRSTYTTASHAQPDSDENFGKSNISEKNENVNDNTELADTKLEGQEKEQVAKEKGKGLKLEDGETKAESMADVCGLRDLDAERDLEITPPLGSDHDNKSSDNHLQLPEDPSTNLPQNSAPPGVDQTVEQERSNLESNRWRVVFNVFLALVLVTKWAYVNLQCLLSTGVDDTSRMHLVQSEVREHERKCGLDDASSHLILPILFELCKHEKGDTLMALTS